jgi:mannose-6-phosphate isomerase-like protein (cupin superfamily)
MIVTKKLKYPALIKNQNGEIIQEVLGVQAGGVYSHSIAEITIPPGGSALPHFHRETEESYLILAGVATMQINDKPFELEAGEAVLIEPNEVHQITNNGEENLLFLAVCVPAWQPEDSFDANPEALG